MKFVFLLAIFVSSTSFSETVSRELLSELYKIRTEIKTAVFEKARYQQDILKAEIDIENQNQELAKNQNETNEIKDKILERVSTLYKIRRTASQGTWLSISKDDNFLRKSYYLKYLNAQDKKLVTEFKNKSELGNKLKDKVQNYQKRLKALQKKSEIRFAELNKQEVRQRELIREIRESINGQDAPSLQKKFISELRGQLPLPVSGQTLGKIGLARDTKTRLSILKTGINISSNKNSEVKSIFDGEVLHADNIDGWGPTVIIDHGESYYSVYSHLKNLSVRPGEKVTTQQKLAEVSGVTYHNQYVEPSLYFEFRHFSEPEDPREWFKSLSTD